MHLHLFSSPKIVKEGRWSLRELDENLRNLSNQLKKSSIEKGLVIILDTNFLKSEKKIEYLRNERKSWSNIFLCFMFDFRKSDSMNLLMLAKTIGAKAVKFHPLLQKITEKDFPKVKELAKEAEKLGFFIVIDCAYATKKISESSGIKLSAYLSDLAACPIIMAHSGGALVSEAFNIAADSKNLYLDASFSLDFWKGSSVEKDFALAFKKLGSDRCVYGSDAPSVEIERSVKAANNFFKKYDFPEEDINNIMYSTADKILRK